MLGAVADGNSVFSFPESFDVKCRDRNNPKSNSNDSNRSSRRSLYPQVPRLRTQDQGSETFKSSNPPHNIIDPTDMGRDPLPTPSPSTNSNADAIEGRRFSETQLMSIQASRELGLDMEDLDIPWDDLVLKERIGSG